MENKTRLTVDDVVSVFEYLYQRHYSSPEFELRVEGQNLKIIQNFLAKLSPYRGSSFLWHYSLFGFSWYKNQLTDRKITVGWIYGKKMIERYDERSSAADFYTQIFKYSKGLKNPLSKLREYEMTESYKVLQREKYFNSIRGFLHCESFGEALYDRKNAQCMRCNFKDKCENMYKNHERSGDLSGMWPFASNCE